MRWRIMLAIIYRRRNYKNIEEYMSIYITIWVQINWKNLLFSIFKVLKREHRVSCLLSIYHTTEIRPYLCTWSWCCSGPWYHLIQQSHSGFPPKVPLSTASSSAERLRELEARAQTFWGGPFAAEMIEIIWKFFTS